jgi:hypothetical protein
MSIYEKMKAAGVPIDRHESDLYVPVNDTTKAIIRDYELKDSVGCFLSCLDGKLWFDIPFAWLPFWEAATR